MTVPSFDTEVLPHTITHYIKTSVPPIHCKARCLALEILQATKEEFQLMLKFMHYSSFKE